MKLKICLFLIGMLLFSVTVQAFDLTGGKADQGKEDFQKCRKCHDGVQARKIGPANKTMRQWERYFDQDFRKLKKKMPAWDSYGFTEPELENIHRYLYDHALDSAQPQTCD